MAFEQDPLKQKKVIIIASTATIKISSARLGKKKQMITNDCDYLIASFFFFIRILSNWTIVGGWGNKDSFIWDDDYPDTDKWTELIENDDDEGIEKWEWQNEKEMEELMTMAKEEVLDEASGSE